MKSENVKLFELHEFLKCHEYASVITVLDDGRKEFRRVCACGHTTQCYIFAKEIFGVSMTHDNECHVTYTLETDNPAGPISESTD